MVLIFSCEELGSFIVNCGDCTAEEPIKANLEIRVQPIYNSTILIKIFEGNLEDSVLYGMYTTNSTMLSQWVPLNKKYTVTATYHYEGTTYIAVDSTTPHVKFVEEQCKEPCYFVYNRKIDLRLKSLK